VLTTSYYQIDDRFIEIGQLEVHPNYRRQGIATELFKTMLKDCPDKNLYLECGGDEYTYQFYARLGFCYFFKDVADEIYHFIRPVDAIEKIMQCFKEQNIFHPTDNITYAGCIWSPTERRFINTHRLDHEELVAVNENPWEIYSVRKQTLQLQWAAVMVDPHSIMLITNPLPEIYELETAGNC
jgi:GNAT superfamily N-acetyltransferase